MDLHGRCYCQKVCCYYTCIPEPVSIRTQTVLPRIPPSNRRENYSNRRCSTCSRRQTRLTLFSKSSFQVICVVTGANGIKGKVCRAEMVNTCIKARHSSADNIELYRIERPGSRGSSHVIGI